MISEKIFEDILCKYPELIEEGLTLKGQQITMFGRRMDILFDDKFKRKLLIELKAGPIKDEHLGQILSYEGMLLSADDPAIRVMLIGTRVPPNLQRSLDHHGIAWKEITNSKLDSFLRTKNDEEFLEFFEPSAIEKKSKKIHKNNEIINSDPSPVVFKDIDMKIKSFKNSEWYKSFLTILDDKKENEEKARVILEKNHGNLNPTHLKNVITLVNGPYPFIFEGKKDAAGPWFGQLLSKPNTENFFKTDVVLINNWFKVLKDNNIPVHRRIDILKLEPYKINGVNAGFITLMLYLLDKPVYSIWFGPMHEGLKIIYPEIGNYTGNGAQYTLFNKRAKDFLHKFDFDHTELDWILFSKFRYSRELR